jgi:hypothetical protein
MAAISRWLDEQGNGSIRSLTIQHVARHGREPEHIQLIYSDIAKVEFVVMEEEVGPFGVTPAKTTPSR